MREGVGQRGRERRIERQGGREGGCVRMCVRMCVRANNAPCTHVRGIEDGCGCAATIRHSTSGAESRDITATHVGRACSRGVGPRCTNPKTLKPQTPNPKPETLKRRYPVAPVPPVSALPAAIAAAHPQGKSGRQSPRACETGTRVSRLVP